MYPELGNLFLGVPSIHDRSPMLPTCLSRLMLPLGPNNLTHAFELYFRISRLCAILLSTLELAGRLDLQWILSLDTTGHWSSSPSAGPLIVGHHTSRKAYLSHLFILPYVLVHIRLPAALCYSGLSQLLQPSILLNAAWDWRTPWYSWLPPRYQPLSIVFYGPLQSQEITGPQCD